MATDLRTIAVEQLVPSRNIRSDLGDLAELTDSIREHGILQPIRVRPLVDGRFQVIAGHRRVAAARAAGLATVPAMVADETDSNVAVQNVVENLQREDLSPLELARGVRQLQSSYRLDVDEIAHAISKSPGQVRTLLRASHLPESVLAKIESGERGTQDVRGFTLRHVGRLLSDVSFEDDADDATAAAHVQQAADRIDALIQETDRRAIRLNAHQADEVSRQVRSGRMTVKEAVDLVTANPERFRYSRPYANPDELQADTWGTYREIQRQLTGLSARLRPEIAESFGDRERADLLSSLDDALSRLAVYRGALAGRNERPRLT